MSTPTDLSLLSLILRADIVVKCIIAILLLLSVLIWAVFFEKILQFRSVTRKSDIFEKRFWSGIMLEEFFEKNKTKLKHPMGEVFARAMDEWMISEANQTVSAVELIKKGLRERIFVSTSVALFNVESQILKYTSFLSVVATVSPFIGLLGTVWGIMNSFKAIAGASSVGLNVVAPGIAEALLTTAIGIFVAICSSLLHQVVVAKADALLLRIETFRSDMLSILSRELDGFSVRNYKSYQEKNAGQK